MKALKIIGIILLVLVVGIAGFVMSLKGESHLERSIIVNAPAEKVFRVVNDFSYNDQWSPWFMIDPDTKYVFSENTSGVGAYYEWDSENPEVMKGRQEMLESRSNEYVNTSMEFVGMTGTYTAAFILEPNGEGTEVTWTYEGKADAVGEKFFIDYLTESMLAPSYEEGLENLKKLVEGLPDPAPVQEVLEVDSTEVEAII